jgi:DNA-binding CsgD family transcriptional regulator
VRLLQTYSKHSLAAKALVDLRLKAESEHRAPELNGSTRGTARQLRPDEVDDLVASYETVRNIRQVADAFGLYRETVREHLKRRGIEVRQVRSMTDKERAQAVELYETSHSSVIVDQKLGFSNHTILNALRAAGAEVRKQPGRR